MKLNYVNADHVHALIDQPTNYCVEEVMHLFKGSSSHWINENNLGRGKFGWGSGYGVFQCQIPVLPGWPGIWRTRRSTIEMRSFSQVLELLVKRHGLNGGMIKPLKQEQIRKEQEQTEQTEVL